MSSTTDRIATGLFCWSDLGTSDLDAGKKFYSGLFGYEFKDMPSPTGLYCMMSQQGKTAAAMYQNPPAHPHPPHWMPYVMVDDCDATTERARGLGATIELAGHDVPHAGRMAIIIDPVGAVFALWQAAGHGGHGAAGLPGAMCWNEMISTDPARSVEFYTALFGWTAKDEATGPMSVTVLSQGDTMVADVIAQPEMMKGAPAFWLTYFSVPKLDEWRARAEKLGATALMPRMDISFGSFSVIKDPQGAVLALWEGKLG